MKKKKASSRKSKPVKRKTKYAGKTKPESARLASLQADGGELGACWFSDSGGSDQCVPLTEDECKSRGGTWTPGPCPNS